MKSLNRGFDKVRLRWLLALFFLALAAPAAVLIFKAYSQLKWEAVHRHRELAAELASRIDGELAALIDAEEARSFADYAFLVVSGDAAANFLQRSPLSAYPVDGPLPGLVGYFQVDAEGAFSSPLVPDDASSPLKFGISRTEYAQRLALTNQIRQVLADNRLVGARAAPDPAPAAPSVAPAEAQANAAAPARSTRFRDDDAPETAGTSSNLVALRSSTGQVAFDRLEESADEQTQTKVEGAGSLGRVEDLELDQSYQERSLAKERRQRPTVRESERSPERSKRKEQIYLPESKVAAAEPLADAAAAQFDVPIRAFEGEIDPFAFSPLDSGHFVLFRKVWRGGQRTIQGALIERAPFLRGLIERAFRDTSLAQMSDLIVAYQGEVMAAYRASAGAAYGSSAADLAGTVLYQSALSAPLSAIELIFSVTRLPSGPGAAVINWVAVILGAVLIGGCVLLYRLGIGQIELARQQQDFVSAVSHELKTPLTSIRMYGEMLREGWADEAKKRSYYEYIYAESERLSRLIANVLQLARMTRNEAEPDLRAVSVAEAIDLVRSKVASQVERAGFELRIDCPGDAGERTLEIDADGFVQVFINLIDNALKFAAGAERKTIELTVVGRRQDGVVFSVRDFGPGVPRGQLKKIFRLFYRSESELTRETVGTGIGLALVNQLVQSMGGKVDARNRDPGAEFRVLLPEHSPSGEPLGLPTDRPASNRSA